MTLPNRHMLKRTLLGAIVALALAPAGFADDLPNGFDTSNLVKFDDSFFNVEYEDWVATEPLSVQRVKKIEAGKVSQVTITTTATGTYSTDGLTSRHVEYPGISVDQVYPWSYWHNGRWFSFSSYRGNSFIYLRNGDVRVSTSPSRTCVSGPNYRVC